MTYLFFVRTDTIEDHGTRAGFSGAAHDICRSSTWTTKRFGNWKQADLEDDDLVDQAILDSRFVLMGRAIAA